MPEPQPDPARRTGARTVVRAVLGSGVVALGLLSLIWSWQRSLIYFPDEGTVPAAHQVLPAGQDVRHRTADGLDLGAWYVPAQPEADRQKAVLYLPGNGGNRAGRTQIGEELAQRGFAVLLVDYRGFGANPGRPSEEGLAADARSAQQALTELGYGPDRTIYVGESLGTGVAARLAAEVPPAGLVLRSPLTHLADVARAHYPFLPVGVLLREDYDVVGHLGRVRAPVAVMYSQADEVVPAEQSARVAGAEPVVDTLVLDGAGHNDPVMFGAPLADLVADLADRTGGS
ncbi:alpha/beta hydrolase [Pseudactinotalea sp. Z1732]|uniref:alpha/beta hydrolase n=1 Tax=Pseudactinotalea sp. Z1732 TaxID=3413026 RepID=UPI003C7CB72C